MSHESLKQHCNYTNLIKHDESQNIASNKIHSVKSRLEQAFAMNSTHDVCVATEDSQKSIHHPFVTANEEERESCSFARFLQSTTESFEYASYELEDRYYQ